MLPPEKSIIVISDRRDFSRFQDRHKPCATATCDVAMPVPNDGPIFGYSTNDGKIFPDG
jgi:hypothetical protein